MIKALQFDIKNVVDQTDIPIGYVAPYDYSVGESILSYDLASFIPGNNTPAVNYIKSKGKSFKNITELEIKSPFSDVEITDEQYYDIELKDYLPLWYKHTLTSNVYNKSLEKARYIEKNCIGDTIITNIANKEKEIIYKSEKIYKAVNQEIIKTYHLNYSQKSIHAFINEKTNIIIEFETILSDIIIKQNDNSKYVLYYEKVNDNEYVLNILTQSSEPLEVTYFKKGSGSDSIELTERTNPIRIYNKIKENNIFFAENKEKKIFSVIPDYNIFKIYVSENKNGENKYKTFYFRQKENVYTKIYLKKSLNLNNNIPWNIEISGNGYIYKNGNKILTFQPYELESSDFIKEIVEIPYVQDNNTLKVNYTPQWNIDREKNIKGVSILDENGNALQIKEIHTTDRIIKIRNEIGIRTKLKAYYKTKQNLNYIDNNLNPLIDSDCYNYYHLYFILPNEHVLPEKKKTIFIHKISKFFKNTRIVYNTKDFINYFILNKQIILDEISDYLVPGITPEPFLFSVFYIETPVDQDYITILDSRVRGGGYIEETEYCGDWSYWNGELIDISGIIRIEIKNSILQGMKERYLQWDEETIRDSNPEIKALTKAKKAIEDSVIKHTRIGMKYQILYIEG